VERINGRKQQRNINPVVAHFISQTSPSGVRFPSPHLITSTNDSCFRGQSLLAMSITVVPAMEYTSIYHTPFPSLGTVQVFTHIKTFHGKCQEFCFFNMFDITESQAQSQEVSPYWNDKQSVCILYKENSTTPTRLRVPIIVPRILWPSRDLRTA